MDPARVQSSFVVLVLCYLRLRITFSLVINNLYIGSNNQGEFRALFFLLKCALENNIVELQGFGDYVMAIKWMNKEIQVHGTGLSQLALQLKDISGLFQKISFTHIYKELNNYFDSLSKEAFHLDVVLNEFTKCNMVSSTSYNLLDFYLIWLLICKIFSNVRKNHSVANGLSTFWIHIQDKKPGLKLKRKDYFKY
jgi:hypothetical protein